MRLIGGNLKNIISLIDGESGDAQANQGKQKWRTGKTGHVMTNEWMKLPVYPGVPTAVFARL